MTAIGVFVHENETCKVVFSGQGKDARVAADVRSAANVTDAAAGGSPECIVGSVAQVGQLHVFLEGVCGLSREALNDVVDSVLELNDLRAECHWTFAGAVAAEPLRANPQTRFGVNVVHRHLVGVLGDRHAHGLKLSSDVGGCVGFLDGSAHSSFPFWVTQSDQVFGKGTGLSRIEIDEIVLVIGGEPQPRRAEHKHGGDHQHHNADGHQGLRREHVGAAPPRRVFVQKLGVFRLRFLLQTQNGVLGAAPLQALDELGF